MRRRTVLPMILLAVAMIMVMIVPAMAQQVTGTLGAPDATMTIDGKQLPAPDPKYRRCHQGRCPPVESMVGAAHRAPQAGTQRPAHHHG